MSIVKRNFKYKDVEMVLIIYTMAESAIQNKVFLSSKNDAWRDPFFETFKTEIDSVMNGCFGFDNAKSLRQSTQAVKAIQKQASGDLSEFKLYISEYFKKDKVLRDEILKQLGFTSYLKMVQKKDQESLVSLLYQFKSNMTPELKSQIMSKGSVPERLLEKIRGYAEILLSANIAQENHKGVRKVITEDSIVAFNKIYDDGITIAKLARKYFKDMPALRDQFNISKIANALNAKGKAGELPTPDKPSV